MPTSITPTTIPIKFITTSEANLNDINIVAGQIIYTTEGNIYYDQSNLSRVRMTIEPAFTVENNSTTLIIGMPTHTPPVVTK